MPAKALQLTARNVVYSVLRLCHACAIYCGATPCILGYPVRTWLMRTSVVGGPHRTSTRQISAHQCQQFPGWVLFLTHALGVRVPYKYLNPKPSAHKPSVSTPSVVHPCSGGQALALYLVHITNVYDNIIILCILRMSL